MVCKLVYPPQFHLRDAVDSAPLRYTTPRSSKSITPTSMWSLWSERPVPLSENGCKTHARWYVIEMRFGECLKDIKRKFTQWCDNVDLSQELLKDWNPNLTLGSTIQSMNKGNYYYLTLKNVSHKTPKMLLFKLLQNLERDCKIEMNFGWVRWLTGENEDMQFDIRRTGLGIILLGTFSDQMKVSTKPTKIPWEESPEKLLLEIPLVLTKEEELLSSTPESPVSLHNCITHIKAVHCPDQMYSGNVPTTTIKSVKTKPSEVDQEYGEALITPASLSYQYDTQGCSSQADSMLVTSHIRAAVDDIYVPVGGSVDHCPTGSLLNQADTKHSTLKVQTVEEEAAPTTMWAVSTQKLIPVSVTGVEIHGRWYIMQMNIHDIQRMTQELTQWSRHVDLNKEYLKNWNPKITLGITENSSTQKYKYYLILKNVSCYATRSSLLYLLETLGNHQIINTCIGWVRWLTGAKEDTQLDIFGTNLKLLLMGTVGEQKKAAEWAIREPWYEKSTALLLDISLGKVALEETTPALLTPNSSAPSAMLTQSSEMLKTWHQPGSVVEGHHNVNLTNTPAFPNLGNTSSSESLFVQKAGATPREHTARNCERKLQCSQNQTQRSKYFKFRAKADQQVQFESQNSQFSQSVRNLTSKNGQNNSQGSEYSQFVHDMSQISHDDTQRSQYSQFRAYIQRAGVGCAQSESSQNYQQTHKSGESVVQHSQNYQVGTNNFATPNCSAAPGVVTAFADAAADDAAASDAAASDAAATDAAATDAAANDAAATDATAADAATEDSSPADLRTPVQPSLLTLVLEEKLLRNLQQKHYKETGIHVNFTVTSRNPLTVQCSVCNEAVQPGSTEQQFTDLRCHLLDESHTSHLRTMDKGNQVEAVFKWIDATYKNEFVLKRKFAACRCDKTQISLLPGDNPYDNITFHLNTKKHKTARTKFVNSEDIIKYFKIKKVLRK
ncbi:hypothetical protein OTU49_014926 [Cherax quadricarinatus]|uniref:Uncharacterized protein n=1 Tax=Cherax quadricarinatus TaxID=27406 RepID=A0AAW0Y1T8_CHEQU